MKIYAEPLYAHHVHTDYGRDKQPGLLCMRFVNSVVDLEDSATVCFSTVMGSRDGFRLLFVYFTDNLVCPRVLNLAFLNIILVCSVHSGVAMHARPIELIGVFTFNTATSSFQRIKAELFE